MRPFLRSLYGRLSVLYLALSLALCMICAWITMWHFDLFIQEVQQDSNRHLAQNLADELAPALHGGLDTLALRADVRHINALNPSLELYVLDEGGHLLVSSIGPDKIQKARVAMGPVRDFLDEDARLPIRGEDPSSLEARKVFSAAPVDLGPDAQGYLYVILRGMPLEASAQMLQDSYIMRTLALSLLVTLLFTGVTGLLLFALMTRRFRRLTATVQRFKEGDYQQRVQNGTEDEIGELGRAFNEMAGTIEAQVEALRRTDEARRKLVADVSHDLRTPLTSTRAYVERMLMRSDVLSPEEQRAYLQAILTNTVQLSRLAEQMAELSRLDVRPSAPQVEPFPLAELAQDVLVKFNPEAEQRDVHLLAEYDPRLPRVCADIGLVERVLSNLIANAVQNTPAGGTVRLRLTEQPHHVRVVVADTGFGIPPDEVPLVAQRFYQTQRSRARGTSGSGLGLAIAREILERHGSTLHLESTEGKGTTVAFSLSTEPPTSDA